MSIEKEVEIIEEAIDNVLVPAQDSIWSKRKKSNGDMDNALLLARVHLRMIQAKEEFEGFEYSLV